MEQHYDTNYDQNLQINVNHRGERSKSDLQLARTFRWLYSTDLYIEVEPFRARIISVSTKDERNQVAQIDIALRDSDWMPSDNLTVEAEELIVDIFMDPFYRITPSDSHETIDLITEAFHQRIDWEDFRLRQKDEDLLKEFNVVRVNTSLINDYSMHDLTKDEVIAAIKAIKQLRG